MDCQCSFLSPTKIWPSPHRSCWSRCSEAHKCCEDRGLQFFGSFFARLISHSGLAQGKGSRLTSPNASTRYRYLWISFVGAAEADSGGQHAILQAVLKLFYSLGSCCLGQIQRFPFCWSLFYSLGSRFQGGSDGLLSGASEFFRCSVALELFLVAFRLDNDSAFSCPSMPLPALLFWWSRARGTFEPWRQDLCLIATAVVWICRSLGAGAQG